mmetsp:Transcript_64383/g.112399  ORF Transcript_64383/g.112399 Transcript_64383/m.112399 type:complete len:375 (+) Transcript_64383:105-1229(+)
MSRARGKKLEDDFDESILARLIVEHQQIKAEEEFTNDVGVLFCGMKKSGKTSLIDRFIKPEKDEKDQPKPTVALDYKFARYASETSTSKVLAHIYDLGGDENFEDLTRIAASKTTVGNLVLAVTVDMSEPHLVVPSLEKWLQLLRQQVERSFQALAQESQGGARRIEALQKSRREAWEEHQDKAMVKPFPVPLVIFGTKCDMLLAETDPEKRKGLCRALRFFAHINGASLIFTSLRDKPSMNLMRAILRLLLFGVTSKGGIPEQLDPSKPISIFAGKDNLQSIGLPHGARENTCEQAFREMAAILFPDAEAGRRGGKRSESEQVGDELLRFSESSIDGMVEQRQEELIQYRRQVERNQRLASEGVDGTKIGVFG